MAGQAVNQHNSFELSDCLWEA